MILDSQTALTGAWEGMTLCLQTVIPSLFPFFVLSDLLTGSVRSKSPFLCKLFHIPEGSQGLLLAGLLGGYPVGARCVSQSYESGKLSREEAGRMLLFCNTCGPAFLFGIGSGLLGSLWQCLWAWMILLFTAWLTALLLPQTCQHSTSPYVKRQISVTDSLSRAIKAMASVCGWIILFRIGLCFLDKWLLSPLPELVRITVSGFFELANGCMALHSLSSTGLRFLLFVGMTSFGGLCVSLQTLSVLSPQIPRRAYLPGKLFTGSAAITLAWLVQLFFPNPVQSPLIPIINLTFSMLSGIFLRKSVKNSSISSAVGV